MGAMAFVPLVAALATQRRLQPWLLTLLYLTPMLAEVININFVSWETYRGPDRGFEVNLTDLLTWGIVLGLLAKERSRLIWLPFNSIPLLLFFGACLVSTVGAPLKLLAFFTLWKLAKLYLVYWCTVNLLSLRGGLEFRYVGYAMTAISVAVGLLAFKQKYLEGLYRIHGPFDHSNTVPIFMLQMLPVLLLWASCDRKVPRPVAGLALMGVLGGAFAIAATQSRAGIVLVGLTLVGAVMLAVGRWPSRRSIAISLIFVMLGGIGALKALDSFITRLKTAPEASEAAREEFNHAAELMVQDRPWTGVGINSFSYVLTRTPAYNGHIVVMANEEQAGVAHHIYLLTAAETGYPGILLFLFCLLRWWLMMLRAGLRGKTFERTYLLGYFLGFGCFFLIGFLEWAFRISPVSYFVAVNMAVATSLASRQRQAAPALLRRVKTGPIDPRRPASAGPAGPTTDSSTSPESD
jgi:O-antigen ligase